jgi:hypothetical protein
VTSERKLSSNRANAKASTGPKTARGKARASQNARRHGLSTSINGEPSLSAAAENLARIIAGEGATPNILEVAHRVAEAQTDVMRVRRARHELLSRAPHDQEALQNLDDVISWEPQGADAFGARLSDLTKQLAAFDRYERRALSRRKFAIRELDALQRQSA